MKLEFDPLTHTYKYNGIVVVGVNEVMDSIGVRNRCADCRGSGCGEVGSCDSCNGTGYTSYKSLTGSEYMGDPVASRFGTALHDYIKYNLQDRECEYHPNLQPWINGYHKFMKDHKIKPQLIEEKMYHPVFKYAGEFDLFGHRWVEKPRTSQLILIDWKSSTTISKCVKWQLAAYAELIKYNLKINRKIHRLCVQILPDDYKATEYKGADFNMFLSYLNIYKTFGKTK